MARTKQTKLTPADVVFILQSKEPNQILAVQFNVTRQAISLVRNGKSHLDIAPEIPRIPVRLKGSQIPRKNAVHCRNCVEWNGEECYFGFPEAINEPTFANECSLYTGNQKHS